MKRKVWMIISATPLILGLVLNYTCKGPSERVLRNFKQFYESNLEDTLTDVGIKLQGASFKTRSNGTEYVFYPYGRHYFPNFAKPGDVVLKPAFSDTLILIKEGIAYRFGFRKFSP